MGAAVVKLIEDQLQVLLPRLIGTAGNFEIIVFGIVLVLVLKYAPNGLWPYLSGWVPKPRRVRDWADAPALARRPQPAPGEALLQVDAVRKQFGGLVAVNDVSFAIRTGEIEDITQVNYADLVDVQELQIEEGAEPLRLELESFTASVKEGTPVEVPATDGLRAVELAERIVAAMPQRAL